MKRYNSNSQTPTCCGVTLIFSLQIAIICDFGFWILEFIMCTFCVLLMGWSLVVCVIMQCALEFVGLLVCVCVLWFNSNYWWTNHDSGFWNELQFAISELATWHFKDLWWRYSINLQHFSVVFNFEVFSQFCMWLKGLGFSLNFNQITINKGPSWD